MGWSIKGQSGALDFEGTARLEAPVSKMRTGFKRKLPIPLDALFKRDGRGCSFGEIASGY